PQVREPECRARGVDGDRLEPPLHRGNERQRSLRPDEKIELIPRVGEMIQRVPRRVLARLWEPGLDESPLVGRQDEPLPAPCSLGDTASVALRVDYLDRLDPAPGAAAPHRPRPGRVG